MMQQRRAPGTGTIEPFRGRFRARLPDAKRSVFGVFETAEEARRALDGYLDQATAPKGDSLSHYGPPWLEQRERSGLRHQDRERQRWKNYIETWECYTWPLGSIRRGDVRRWVNRLAARKLADQTIRNALNLLRQCLQHALDDELIETNPAVGMKVHKRGSVRDKWTYLNPEEQEKLLGLPEWKMPPHTLYMVKLAIGTGIRWGEQRTLQLDDVHLEGDRPHLIIRRSVSEDAATKNTKPRRVPLFGLGLQAANWLWLDAKTRHNPLGLLCVPIRKNRSRYHGKKGPPLTRWLRAAGIERRVRWHDLRHTCGSSLSAGWWGHRWALEEIRDFLGHSTITMTERYAHLAGSIVEDAAAKTTGPKKETKS